jgi:hypothetical protein
VTARPPAAGGDIVMLVLALDMLQSYAQTQRTIAISADNKLKSAAMQAILPRAYAACASPYRYRPELRV